ncbi:MAG TPA: prephenate dehydrogenase/arogenate dehydrogenase family protein [Gammaproteobacteria bacterium]|nr:prephenate dehydrogenase/arogenate dehydrogenase family protein [Gammaproteobacteria bacterium]
MSEPFRIKRLCLIGVGLIGGSLLRALRRADVVDEIVGCGRSRESLQSALKLGVIDHIEQDPAKAVLAADMVVLAVPLGAMQGIFSAIAPALAADAVLTDVGSAKGSVVRAAEQAFSELPSGFVPAHPIAGTEKSGVEASFAELFDGRRVILTPTAQSSPAAVRQTRAMWQACGAEVIEMDVAHHDEVLAATSHLPHMLAYSLVDMLARRDDSQEIFDYAAGGFRDFTRIASSDPTMWHDIALANEDALATLLEQFSLDLQKLAEAVREGDSDYLKSMFTRAKQARDEFQGPGTRN